MKNVLVIGSTGQIGSELTMALRKIYHQGQIVAGYIPGSAWLLAQAVTGYALMTGEQPDAAAMAAVR